MHPKIFEADFQGGGGGWLVKFHVLNLHHGWSHGYTKVLGYISPLDVPDVAPDCNDQIFLFVVRKCTESLSALQTLDFQVWRLQIKSWTRNGYAELLLDDTDLVTI